MVEKISWQIGAQVTFNEAVSYLEENFSEKEVSAFVRRVYHKIDLLKSHPHLGKGSENKKNIYKVTIHKKIILIYQYKPRKRVMWSKMVGDF